MASSWDHPRSCGKDQKELRTKELQLGSPPLVRERLQQNGSLVAILRITPARAGKTNSFTEAKALHEDHPRSCGKDPASV